MLSGTFGKGLDARRLKAWLAVFFLALTVPTVALIWQAYTQLKWEAFHQSRGLAEDLVGRIDVRLIDIIRAADARSFADYTFLNVTGDTRYNFVQRSPLSTYPVNAALPGVIGYFQVDTNGTFSTPLLPLAGTDVEKLGIGNAEYSNRFQLAQQIQAVLADHSLVQSKPEYFLRRGLATPTTSIKASLEDDKEGDSFEETGRRSRQYTEDPRAEAELATASFTTSTFSAGGFLDEIAADNDAADDSGDEPLPESVSVDSIYGQQVFDLLKQPREDVPVNPADAEKQQQSVVANEAVFESVRGNTIGKVSELKLDADLQNKSEDLELAQEEQRLEDGNATAPARFKRREQITLPEAATAADRQPIANISGPTDLRISTFESEIDPLEFSQLGSGHLVFFRNVWREGERYVQGLLVDQGAFVAGAIEQAFHNSPLSDISNLIVGYRDDVIAHYPGTSHSYASVAGESQGDLLYRSRLSAPLGSLELVFSINRLPQGPGATVLGWVTLVLALVFIGGFITMYRFGLGQINLARQQQDFVSAVSHELKTPLTSIRMYGEMLREGWADEAKRQDYYEFIHDESERLTRMITNVLQLAKITRNEPNFDLKATNVGQLMGNIESKIADQVERAGYLLEFNRDQATDAAQIDIDEDCFAQIIINLVDNAIKFSKNAEKKAIEIGCRLTSDRQIQISVRDHGPGIPRNQMKKIFKLFYRTESELTRETVGTGIGLAIVHQLAVAMNGQVDVVNCNPGAEFRISFPAV